MDISVWIMSVSIPLAFVLGILSGIRSTKKSDPDTIARLTSGGTPEGKSRCRCWDDQDKAYCDFKASDRCDGEFIDD